MGVVRDHTPLRAGDPVLLVAHEAGGFRAERRGDGVEPRVARGAFELVRAATGFVGALGQ